MDYSLPLSSIQARVLVWVAISFSRESSQPRDQTRVSRAVGRFFTIWTTRESYLAYSFYQILYEVWSHICFNFKPTICLKNCFSLKIYLKSLDWCHQNCSTGDLSLHPTSRLRGHPKFHFPFPKFLRHITIKLLKGKKNFKTFKVLKQERKKFDLIQRNTP